MNWELERHNRIKDELGFWRNKNNSGFVTICSVENPITLKENGKYQLAINTMYTLKTRYFNDLDEAVNFALKWMREHPEG